MITIRPNFLGNAKEIVHALQYYQDKFKPRIGPDVHESIIPGLRSDFSTLKDVDMDNYLIDLIFKDAHFDGYLKDTYNFIQIQRYLPGQFICPHKDVYSIVQLHLVVLTDSDTDGLTVQNGDGLKTIYDMAGTYIDVGDAYHWVNPVKNLRYSLVVTE